jgi:hypothetical protein
LVWKPDGRNSWARTHAMVPTPVKINDDLLRIYVTCLDEKGCGRPGYVDVAATDPTNVLAVSPGPMLDIGTPGCFDDNGLIATSLVEPEPGVWFMYYAGFELCTHIRYRIFSGLAISQDHGMTYKRYRRTPILERSNEELYFRGGPFAMFDENAFKLWYVAGSAWTNVGEKVLPVYDLRYQESKDGIHWSPSGQVVLPITHSDEHGFGRPWVVKRGKRDYQLFYSIRRRSLAGYRLGYAESMDGIHWIRKDDEMGLDISTEGFDSKSIMYAAVISAGGKIYCFYNGNNFGEAGFSVSELES